MSPNNYQLTVRRWAAVRRMVLNHGGSQCAYCGRTGLLEVDHIIPLERDPGQDPYSLAGCQALCPPCHVKKTDRESRRASTAGQLA